ncbi:MAG: hypothetical protein CMI54_06395 [Parcubacteria group bacterium]|jgi:hypothetical protein|nr:hypothetical protein [Parcubacteria group bacterium]|tara:strand:+ start:3011 stop:3316 length:306 start_codon:yes stop_codon:yes gene_type:complete
MLKVYFLRRLKDEEKNKISIEGQSAFYRATVDDTPDPREARVICEELPALDSLALRTETPTEEDKKQHQALLSSSQPVRNITAEIDRINEDITAIKQSLNI